MTNKEFEEAHEIAFDSFCKSVIRNACRDGHRRQTTLEKHECQISDERELRFSIHEKEYSYSRLIAPIGNELVGMDDPVLAEAIRRLPHRNRELVYKSFFLEMKDEEIAVSQHIKVQTVKRTKYNVLKKLKRFIRELEYGGE